MFLQDNPLIVNVTRSQSLASCACPRYIRHVHKADRTWELLCHVSALLLLVPHVRFGNVAGPLVVWLVKRTGNPAVDQQGRAALNFQISMTLYFALIWLASLLLGKLPGPFNQVHLLPIVLMRVWEIINLWFIIQAALKVGKGETFKYPLSIRFIPTKV